jgi:hypothetical protein
VKGQNPSFDLPKREHSHNWFYRVEALLQNEPGLQAKTIFDCLQEQHPGTFETGQRRTLERRVQRWRVTSGPAREVMFSQVHHAGDLAASDFTDMSSLGVLIEQFLPEACVCGVAGFGQSEDVLLCPRDGVGGRGW